MMQAWVDTCGSRGGRLELRNRATESIKEIAA